MSEIWRPVPTKPFDEVYEVSNEGNLKRTKNIHGNPSNKILAKRVVNKGYYQAKLNHNNKTLHIQMHRLVALVFIPNPLKKEQINHLDGNKTNNTVSNLEWCTGSENIRHSIDVLGNKHYGGIYAKGEQISKKLKESDVLKIREPWETGNYTHRSLGKVFNVSFATIGSIVRRQTWTHI